MCAGHHMLMILGKTQLMRLFRTRVAQLGEGFVLKDFMDFVADIGRIPWSGLAFGVGKSPFSPFSG